MFRKIINPLLVISLAYVLLLVPETKLMIIDFPSSLPFRWNNDLRFKTLEANFVQNKTLDKNQLSNEVDSLMILFKTTIALLDSQQYSPAHHIFETIEDELFTISTKIVYTPEKLRTFTQLFEDTRYLLKKQSRGWIIDNVNSKNTLYRILYGGRTAIEEIELQLEEKYKSKLSLGFAEPSKTPSHKTHDFILHSGDILVSRGGAATSALISRGSNYPGNFSHVALVYVDDQTNELHIVESHIEKGVVVSTVQEYLEDKKFRIMVLRPRNDLPQLKNNPLLPHLAAKEAYEEAMSQHIPYDFAMDYSNSDEKFCSEVASSVYAQNGINLWLDLSSISSPGIKSWLSDFGVKNFITQEPSDLEYDPQLTVVAEWRDQETLFNDHIDNAIVDILIEDANLEIGRAHV